MNTALLMLTLALAGQGEPATPAPSPNAAEIEPRVEAGREALEGGMLGDRYPWYDSEADDVRRIDVKTPWEWDWSFWDWFRGLFSGWNFDFQLFGFSMNFLQVLVWLALLTLAAGLVYLFTKVYLKKQEKAEQTAVEVGPDVDRVEALPEAARRHVADLLAEARRAYEQGNFGEAIVYLFSHQLLEMDRHQVIRLAKGKTNRQYLREIGRGRPLWQLIDRTMVAFEDVFFGGLDLTRARFEECWSELDRFDKLLQQGVA